MKLINRPFAVVGNWLLALKSTKSPAFTIIELLVVIAIIGILAAVTLVSYTGVANRATAASLQSDLSRAATLLKLDQVASIVYPSSLALANGGKGIIASPGTTYQYSVDNTASPPTFCITATKNNISYKISNDSVPVSGVCFDYGLVLNLDAGNALSYPGTGTTWTDLSGNGNNGTLNGGVTYSSASGGLMIFDGVSGFVDAGNSSSLNTTGALSIGVWTRINAFPTASETNIVDKNGYSQYRVGLTPANYYHTTIRATDGISTNFVNDYGTFFYPSLNTFYYFAYVFDPLVGQVSLYVNGSLYSSKTTSFTSVVASSNNLLIGKFTGYLFYNGAISNVKIYNSALSAAEILQNFNLLRGRYGL